MKILNDHKGNVDGTVKFTQDDLELICTLMQYGMELTDLPVSQEDCDFVDRMWAFKRLVTANEG